MSKTPKFLTTGFLLHFSIGIQVLSLSLIENGRFEVPKISLKLLNRDRITTFDLFSHGLKGKIALGYGQKNSADFEFATEDIKDIINDSFDNAESYFYSCNTGTGENSFAQNWANKVGGTTHAFVGKSDYAHINEGSSLAIKFARFINGGVSYLGSSNYPIAGTTLLDDGRRPYMTIFLP